MTSSLIKRYPTRSIIRSVAKNTAIRSLSTCSSSTNPLIFRSSLTLKTSTPSYTRTNVPAFFRTVATASESLIPIVDFSRFLNASSSKDKVKVSKEITDAFKNSGFVYLDKHGIGEEQLSKTFQMSKQFFDLPMKIKDRLAWKDPRANRGYVAEGRERVTQATSEEEIAALRASQPDYKESHEIGNESDPTFRNEWPTEEELEGYRETMLRFRKVTHELHLNVLKSIAIGLDLEEDFFDKKCHEEWHTLRLLHYPSVEAKKLLGGGSRAGEHSDYGSITLLFQDMVGGLQVKDPSTGEYVAAKPVPGTLVVNVGDLLSRWSNDTLRSTLHRVVAPQAKPESGWTPARQSIAVFCNPNEHQRIECLPLGGNPKYEPIVTGDYLEQRLSETYS